MAVLDYKTAPMQEVAELLSVYFNNLPAKDHTFASSLLFQYKKKGTLSEKQDKWLRILAEKAVKDSVGQSVMPEPQSITGDFSTVFKMLTFAKEKLKNPKIRLVAGGDGEYKDPVVLSIAGEKSKWPGQIMVTDGKPYGNRKFYGRIHPKGIFLPNFKKDFPEMKNVALVLAELAKDPEATAAKYGKLTGHCCFCGKHLSDPKSTAAGYGPICAQKYGLVGEYKGSKPQFSLIDYLKVTPHVEQTLQKNFETILAKNISEALDKQMLDGYKVEADPQPVYTASQNTPEPEPVEGKKLPPQDGQEILF